MTFVSTMGKSVEAIAMVRKVSGSDFFCSYGSGAVELHYRTEFEPQTIVVDFSK